ncbi:MAG: efflux RND transporter periplasmic adaptor subunit [Acidobacteria bacterium]|nr:MAG: efflux RND transporter periplasmic adaptor subunit [Acidobacteriota bacterium]REJ99319.1 MAG: efflux RND transporter periplasmic adaptor subunit [Acidobacteriota bacterium]REK15659.1 MAG: efflux RND transporter periplasmic adaptor subunit [Acidobacteriota bacterium]REK43642.1 MAG: efflux RND transporter periplasmic adaptor subunit [Acidobacteriota bacterium]
MRFHKFIPIAALLVLSVLISASCGTSSANENAANTEEGTGPVSVDTATAEVEQIPTYFEATGSLASDAESDVAPTIGGKIAQVNFDVGSYVKRGDVMVRLDARDAQIRLDQALSQFEQSRKAVDQAEAGVEQAIANLRQTQVRLGVRDGETFDIEDFSQVISVRAQLKLAEAELTRYENLVETGDVSRSAYDQKRSQRDALLGQLREARSNAAVAIRAINTAEAGVKQARAQAANARAAVNTADAQVAQARKAVADNAILAPISGYVSERNADPGEYISPNQPNVKIATIVRTAVLRLKIDVPEQSIGKVEVGQSVSAQVSAYPDRNFAGIIVRKLPSLNPQSRTLTVEAEIDNPGGLLKPGQFATVRITQSMPAPAVMIPASAVTARGETNVVFVIKDGIANERLVQTGLLENDRIEIKQGITENEVVATNNLDKLSDGVIVAQ